MLKLLTFHPLDCLELECLKNLAKTSALVGMIEQIDYNMYNALITHLFLPDLLKPIPQVLTQQIRNFAKCISKWMLNALEGYSGKCFTTLLAFTTL